MSFIPSFFPIIQSVLSAGLYVRKTGNHNTSFLLLNSRQSLGVRNCLRLTKDEGLLG